MRISDLSSDLCSSDLITSNGSVAINSADGTLTIDNAGLIRSDNNIAIMVGTADAQIANSGLIEGGNFGILSGAVQLPGDTAPVLRAVGTDIVNSGTIVGQTNDAIRPVGGGPVDHSGIITSSEERRV